MRYSGYGVSAVAVLVPLIWFLPLTAQFDPTALFSQYAGIASLIAMSIVQLLAIRPKWLEPTFGGMDQMYRAHKWIAIFAILMAFLHDTIDPGMRGIEANGIANDLAETLGEQGYNGLLILTGLTLLTFIPYHIWRYTHKLMGAMFAMCALHFLLIGKPFDNGSVLGLYTLAFCIMGVLCYIYTLVPLRLARVKAPFTVTKLDEAGDALSITLTPQGEGMRHKPGQFAFLRFEQDGLRETHPYTISSAPVSDGTVRFTVKPLGGYTKRLKETLQVGTTAQLSKPYGHFTHRAAGKKPEIWIAGGAGITPFLAFAQTLTPESAPVHLFYSVRDKVQAAHWDELEARAAEQSNLHLHLIETATEGRLNAEKIAEKSQLDLSKAAVYFCGAKAMRETLLKDLQALGVKNRNIHFEEFEIRSGIGLEKLLAFAWRKLQPVLAQKNITVPQKATTKVQSWFATLER